MPTSGIRVLFIGKQWSVPYETEVCVSITNVFSQIAKFRPDVLVTSGDIPRALNIADFELRKRWIHVQPDAEVDSVVSAIEACYSSNLYGPHHNQQFNPLVSVFTGTYNTGDYLRDTYQSLRDQTYSNWEWVVVDDESNDGTWERLLEIADEDHRVRPLRIKHNGKIGAIKDIATRLAKGEFVVELDHDDMLTDNAIDEIRKAFADPEAGMVYSNCASFFADGSPHQFNSEFWNGRYRETKYRGKIYWECINPDIYDRTGPHFSQMHAWGLIYGPNHVRCYRTKTLLEFGGYNPNFPVADDWDVYARFFLYSKCVHIDKMLYLYRFHDNFANTTFTRNKSIQDHLRHGQNHYAAEFDKKNKEESADIQENLSVIIVDWNTPTLTERCMQSVRDSMPEAEIVLVQNGEDFDTTLADKIVNPEINLGFAAACNVGAMHATWDILCFLNSDAVVEKGVLQELVKHLVEGEDVGVVGPYFDKAREPQGGWSQEDVASRAVAYDVPSVVGACMVMRAALFDDLNGFDTQFCNFEDDDLCLRINRIGLKCRVVPVWVQHDEHASFDANGKDADDEIKKSGLTYKEKWPKIAVVAITFNEIKSLPGFFEQFSCLTSDFSILDSGSTDGTLKWAKEHDIKVKKRKFTNFEEQRNAAMKMAGDADWVIMLDPDERLEIDDMNYLWDLARSNEYEIYIAPLRSEDGMGGTQEWVPKVFMMRNRPEIKWVFPVHEKVIGSHKQAMVKNCCIVHHLDWHSKDRRCKMSNLYDSLGDDGQTLDNWPLLNYKNRDDNRIRKIYVGPRVAVVIPTYDRPELLEKALLSAESQDYLPKDIIVVGDCCQDLKPLDIGNPDITITYINLPKNHGAGGAVPRNYGIMYSFGEYIAYLDDDNEWKTNHLSSLMMGIMREQADFGFSSMTAVGSDESRDHIFTKPERGQIDTSCVVHKRSLIKRFGWWKSRDDAGYAHDWEFVRPWVECGVPWVATKTSTVIYNATTSGQESFLIPE